MVIYNYILMSVWQLVVTQTVSGWSLFCLTVAGDCLTHWLSVSHTGWLSDSICPDPVFLSPSLSPGTVSMAGIAGRPEYEKHKIIDYRRIYCWQKGSFPSDRIKQDYQSLKNCVKFLVTTFFIAFGYTSPSQLIISFPISYFYCSICFTNP